MVAFVRQQGLSLALIGTFVAALFLPWSFKWACAPVIDLVLRLATQIAEAGLQSVPVNLFYGIIVAHGLFFGMAFMGMARSSPSCATRQMRRPWSV